MDKKSQFTEPEKNTKASRAVLERKRREVIRESLDRLTELVSGIEGPGISERMVLERTVDHLRARLEERKRLVERIEELGWRVEMCR